VTNGDNPTNGSTEASNDLNDMLALVTSMGSDPVGGSVELLLSQMNPVTARLLRLCAIPHRFNSRVVRVLAPDLQLSEAEEQYKHLLSLSMVTTSSASARLHDRMRGYLFQKWLEPANAEEFARASAALSAHFRLLTESSASEADAEPYQYRAMFHLIGADQRAGFEEFDTIYRERHHQFRLAECERLVNLINEYEPVLTPEHATQLLYCKAQVAADYRRWDDAKRDLFQVLATANTDNSLKVRAENRLGIIEAAERNYGSAINHYNAALTLAKRSSAGHPYSYRIKHDLGVAFRDNGDSDGAEELLRESIQQAEAARDFACVASGYNSLGLLYSKRKETSEAISALQASIGALAKTGDTVREATVYNNIGNIHSAEGRWNESKQWYTRSLEITERTNDTYGQAVALSNLASVYQQAKDYKRAIEALEKAAQYFEGLGDPYRTGIVGRKLGRLYWRLGRQPEARASFERAISFFERRNGQAEALETRTELDRLGTKVGLPWWGWAAVILTILVILGLIILVATAEL
jgi:tetratricopeptide (TPR) repeat protein